MTYQDVLTPAERPLPAGARAYGYEDAPEEWQRYIWPLSVSGVLLVIALLVSGGNAVMWFIVFAVLLIGAVVASKHWNLGLFRVNPGLSEYQLAANGEIERWAALLMTVPGAVPMSVSWAPDGSVFIEVSGRSRDLVDSLDTFALGLTCPDLEVWSADATRVIFVRPRQLSDDEIRVRRALLDLGWPTPREFAAVRGSLAAGDLVVQVRDARYGLDAVAAQADRLAEILGVDRLMVNPVKSARGDVVQLTCAVGVPESPLTKARPVRFGEQVSPGPVPVGRDETGNAVSLDLFGTSTHVAVQGMTRSGKSVALYLLLGQLAPLARSGAVEITGVDPSGLLFKPWAGYSETAELRCSGAGDPEQMVAVLERLVADMDARIESLLASRRDSIRPGVDAPLRLVVLEEYPGLLSTLETADSGRKPAERLLPRARGYVRRLVQESAKAGYRVVMIAQRFDAAIIGGSERANIESRITLKVDNLDAVRMLHPGADAALAAEVAKFKPGFALLEGPSTPLLKMRFDWCSREDYLSAVESGGPDAAA